MPSEREILQQNLHEQALLKKHIKVFTQSIRNKLGEEQPKKGKEEVYQHHIENVHKNFIKYFEKILDKLKLDKYLDLQEIQNEINKAAGKYLLSLEDIRSKVKGAEEQEFSKYLNKMNQAIGEVLVNIEKSIESEPNFNSPLQHRSATPTLEVDRL